MDVTEFAIGAARPRSIRVMQFGEGNFLRAFADMMFDEYNRACGGDLGVVIVQPLPTGMTDVIREQNGLYTVVLRGRENGQNVFRPRVVTCVTDALNPYEEWQKYLGLAKIDTLRLIISNTTEAGIVYTGGDAFSDAPPASYPGKLTRFLFERFSLGKKGLILMPCELIDDNGKKLRETVLKTAAQWALGDAFIRWIEEENIFCSTLVDRIVTGFPRAEKDALYDKIGYTDKLLDVAEPFGLWVIEAPKAVREELPLDACNPVLYTDDVKPYKLRKVRMLNGAHTTMVLASYLIGLQTVGECMKDEDVRAFLGHALVDEIMPNVPLPRDEVHQFAADVCARFENPFNRHELLSIALNSVSKWAARVLPTLEDYVKANGRAPRCLCFGLSALIMFYANCKKGADGAWRGAVNGEEYPVRDDEEALIAFSRLSPDMPPESLAYAVLSDQTLWGRDLRGIPTLEDTVTNQLRDMQLLGVRAAMRKTWSDDHA